ncbi:DUF1854 domain-containing protein [Polynucleobacter sp. AM-26B4]|uniref:cyanophycin metabolism-associated DUF1854 family protein n=1 Tax=Polynucleobacter sp. AM-26B4 TaxID=2689103 RepID=UPI0021079057|nr:DUF1854 domain-containing protein [Polynucleobacter sp. AM-26B4]
MKNFALSKNTFGQLCLRTEDGQFYEQVLPVKAFPISLPGECIAIVDRDGHELIWLDNLNQVSAENQSIIKEELANREFMPVLTKIAEVSSFATPSTWTVETSRGATQFVLKGEEDIRRISKDTYLISDNHGVQYLIENIQTLDKHSRRLLDRFL